VSVVREKKVGTLPKGCNTERMNLKSQKGHKKSNRKTTRKRRGNSQVREGDKSGGKGMHRGKA